MGFGREVLAEVVGMFVADRRLLAAVLAVVLVATLLIELAGLHPLIGGATLLVGALGVVLLGGKLQLPTNRSGGEGGAG